MWSANGDYARLLDDLLTFHKQTPNRGNLAELQSRPPFYKKAACFLFGHAMFESPWR